MSRKPGLSNEEIVRQFDLPERKSKIATLMKQDDVAYCICRSSDSSRFMICCDSCEEWYHGDCIGIGEKAAKDIRRYFCDRCRFEDSTLVTKFKEPKLEHERRKHRSHKSYRCENCNNCLRREDCGRCPGCVERGRCVYRACMKVYKRDRDRSPEWQPPLPHRHRQSRSSSPEHHYRREKREKRRGRYRSDKQKTTKSHRGRKRKADDDDDTEELVNRYPPQQCYGPGCILGSRPNSKYCSDECGIRLATNRIYQVLPQRIQEWSLSPCSAEEKNKKALEEVRSQLKEVRALLKELDERHAELDQTIARGKQFNVEEPEEAEEEESTNETTLYCITCGHEIHSRTAIRHMDKCFNKYEAQTSFGSIYKTRIQGNNMFCDFFNPLNATYCKRLKVLCPEHSKEPKPSANEVCGYPLVNTAFKPTGTFCRASKLNCIKHFSWERLWRAEIDMERVRQWLKVDELVERERELRHDMAGRGGVLALMLHSTYNHEIMDQLTG